MHLGLQEALYGVDQSVGYRQHKAHAQLISMNCVSMLITANQGALQYCDSLQRGRGHLTPRLAGRRNSQDTGQFVKPFSCRHNGVLSVLHNQLATVFAELSRSCIH